MIETNDFEFGDGAVQSPPIKEAPITNQTPQHNVSRNVGLPDPNTPVERREATGRSYNQPSNMQVVSREEHSEIHSQKPNPTPQRNNAGRRPPLNQAVQRQQMSNTQQSSQSQAQAPQTSQQSAPVNKTPKPKKEKKKSKLPIFVIIFLVLALLIVGVVLVLGKGRKLEPQVMDYNTSGRFALSELQNALNNYNAETLDSIVGSEDGDSYLAQEWSYVNGVKLREEFLTKVGSIVAFEYPQVQQLSTTGELMYDDAGQPIMIESYMNGGEAVTVVIPDYNKIALTMDEDIEYITKLFKSSGYGVDDYDWNNEITNLMLQYICDKGDLPTTTVEVTLPIGLNANNEPYIKDDSALDVVLFSSEDFHYMCAKFSQICLGWDGYKDEYYTVQEEQHNPEYDDWYALFIQYYEADNGKFDKRRSKWEPWFLRDENNNYVLDENGEKVVNYYSIKNEDGTDWIQPAETILVDVEKVRQVEDPWVEETGIMYNWIGQYYLQNEYTGSGSTITRVGDGSKDKPAGIGTSIITKVKDVDGNYQDVRVTLLGYWTGEDAITYAEKFSPKNRGFTTASVIKLITYEIKVENLEEKPITITSEMTLCDDNSNISSRTGTMYGFTEEFTLGVGEEIIINDWATSTELEQKYVCWGKSFGRSFSMVYFDVLAGTGDIPTYSAYEQFIGKSYIEE